MLRRNGGFLDRFFGGIETSEKFGRDPIADGFGRFGAGFGRCFFEISRQRLVADENGGIIIGKLCNP